MTTTQVLSMTETLRRQRQSAKDRAHALARQAAAAQQASSRADEEAAMLALPLTTSSSSSSSDMSMAAKRAQQAIERRAAQKRAAAYTTPLGQPWPYLTLSRVNSPRDFGAEEPEYTPHAMPDLVNRLGRRAHLFRGIASLEFLTGYFRNAPTVLLPAVCFGLTGMAWTYALPSCAEISVDMLMTLSGAGFVWCMQCLVTGLMYVTSCVGIKSFSTYFSTAEVLKNMVTSPLMASIAAYGHQRHTFMVMKMPAGTSKADLKAREHEVRQAVLDKLGPDLVMNRTPVKKAKA